MKLKHIALLWLLFTGLTGCNRQQQVQANDQARQAGTKIEQAAANARKNLSDSSITLKVKTAMNSSDRLDTSGINVDTKDKVVHLRGLAATADQKALAERIAKDTVGNGIRVVSELGVKPQVTAKRIQ